MYKIIIIWRKTDIPSEYEPEEYTIYDKFIRLNFKDNEINIPFSSMKYWKMIYR
jgi:hypothetical protein